MIHYGQLSTAGRLFVLGWARNDAGRFYVAVEAVLADRSIREVAAEIEAAKSTVGRWAADFRACLASALEEPEGSALRASLEEFTRERPGK